MQGYRLVEGQYVPIKYVNGRLPSAVLGLHLERAGWTLRFYDPATGQWIPKEHESRIQAEAALHQARAVVHQAQAALHQAEAQRRAAEDELQQSQAQRRAAEDELQQSQAQRRAAEDELQRLRQEIEALRRERPDAS